MPKFLILASSTQWVPRPLRSLRRACPEAGGASRPMGAPSLTFFVKGGMHGPIPRGFCYVHGKSPSRRACGKAMVGPPYRSPAAPARDPQPRVTSNLAAQ